MPVAARPVDDPLTWLDAERSTALLAIELAVRWGLDELAWELAAVVAPYFDHRGLYEEWRHGHRLALDAVREHGNVRGEAELLRGLAQVTIYRDELDRASAYPVHARTLFERLGDRRGEGLAVAGMATIGQIRAAAGTLAGTGVLERAAAVFHRNGDRTDEAARWQTLGDVATARGDHALARHHHDRSTRLLLSACAGSDAADVSPALHGRVG
ncbi:hypothetical protein [Actinophytocola gossypii]|uniref:Uncharacterized protein n=1 Tax=Actinophytocola gossypii TaxID=2812003 RepID=A0ABT2J2Q1_9PSEU|nr:hypothetical protein [Actinophytocola gossypii]MCT2582134.1 hypothetical protein [Actinophytocola gossypii]